jgi:hypothetical protein
VSPLISILRAVHCRSTHHYFAVDALRLVQTDAGLRLRSILLKHHEKYLEGTKDPDNRFRDFQNHVIHVRDGYFGGAPRLAIRWYDRAMGHLLAGRWEDAAYAMGVLSHYFTDPLMPLHTAQSPREPLIHRPMEWSVCKSYDQILKIWTEDEFRLVFQLGDGEGWLAEAILKGARFANRSYDALIDSYNVDLGAENPPAGLDASSRQIFAELFGLAITGLARIVERAAEEAEAATGSALPSFSLSIPAVLAVLQVPGQLWLRRITNSEERKAIQAIVAEYRLTGAVKENIPTEVYIKKRVIEVRERENAWNKRRREQRKSVVASGAQQAEFVVVQPDVAATSELETSSSLPLASDQALLHEPVAAPESGMASGTNATPATLETIDTSGVGQVVAMPSDAASSPSEVGERDDVGLDRPISIPFPVGGRVSSEPSERREADEPNVRQKLLRRIDELSFAPSIGPKTAASFAEIRVTTIGEFLDAPAESLARRLGKRWITATVIEAWQDQTRLMCEVPGLLSRDVQMLVGVGCRTTAALATASATELTLQMRRYASTSDGKRALRGAEPEERSRVVQWIAAAVAAQSKRSAA